MKYFGFTFIQAALHFLQTIVYSHTNKELRTTFRAPDSSPYDASHHIVQPFQNALIMLQVVIFLLPLLGLRLYQNPIIYS